MCVMPLELKADKVPELRGRPCPMPEVRISPQIVTVGAGQVVEAITTDPGALTDFPDRAASDDPPGFPAQESVGPCLALQGQRERPLPNGHGRGLAPGMILVSFPMPTHVRNAVVMRRLLTFSLPPDTLGHD
jgi:TusA-related sulfurtransferase